MNFNLLVSPKKLPVFAPQHRCDQSKIEREDDNTLYVRLCIANAQRASVTATANRADHVWLQSTTMLGLQMNAREGAKVSENSALGDAINY